MQIATQPAVRGGVTLVPPPYPPGTTPQSPLQGGPNSTPPHQAMPHPSMMATHPHYTTAAPQSHFGVAATVYPPGANPGYYSGGGQPAALRGNTQAAAEWRG